MLGTCHTAHNSEDPCYSHHIPNPSLAIPDYRFNIRSPWFVIYFLHSRLFLFLRRGGVLFTVYFWNMFGLGQFVVGRRNKRRGGGGSVTSRCVTGPTTACFTWPPRRAPKKSSGQIEVYASKNFRHVGSMHPACTALSFQRGAAVVVYALTLPSITAPGYLRAQVRRFFNCFSIRLLHLTISSGDKAALSG